MIELKDSNALFVQADLPKKMSPAMSKAYWHAVDVDWRNRTLGSNLGVAMSRRTAQALKRRKMLTIVGDFQCADQQGLVEVQLTKEFKAVAGPSKEQIISRKKAE